MQCSIEVRTIVAVPLAKAAAKFNINLFKALAPAFPQLQIDRYEGQQTGDYIELRLGLWPVWVPWKLTIADHWDEADTWGFVDQGLVMPWPLAAWRHEHRLNAYPGGQTEIVDSIEFTVRLRWLAPMMGWLVRKQMEGRQPAYKAYFCTPD